MKRSSACSLEVWKCGLLKNGKNETASNGLKGRILESVRGYVLGVSSRWRFSLCKSLISKIVLDILIVFLAWPWRLSAVSGWPP
jgi:hypothetical protein